MKNIVNIIEKVQYSTYEYDSEEEKHEHASEMINKGFELLTNFEHDSQATYRKFLDRTTKNIDID